MCDDYLNSGIGYLDCLNKDSVGYCEFCDGYPDESICSCCDFYISGLL